MTETNPFHLGLSAPTGCLLTRNNGLSERPGSVKTGKKEKIAKRKTGEVKNSLLGTVNLKLSPLHSIIILSVFVALTNLLKQLNVLK